MKLISSSPPPLPRPPHRHNRGWFLRRLRSRAFSARAAWWALVAVVAVFAIAVFRFLRHALEANLP